MFKFIHSTRSRDRLGVYSASLSSNILSTCSSNSCTGKKTRDGLKAIALSCDYLVDRKHLTVYSREQENKRFVMVSTDCDLHSKTQKRLLLMHSLEQGRIVSLNNKACDGCRNTHCNRDPHQTGRFRVRESDSLCTLQIELEWKHNGGYSVPSRVSMATAADCTAPSSDTGLWVWSYVALLCLSIQKTSVAQYISHPPVSLSQPLTLIAQGCILLESLSHSQSSNGGHTNGESH